MSRHTPGPWTLRYDHPNPRPCERPTLGTVVGPDGDGVGEGWGNDAEEAEANARLIASAPEMLVALRDIMDRQTSKGDLGGGYFTLSGDCIRRAESAIARAEGREVRP